MSTKEIKTIEQAKELGLDTWLYENGDWAYRHIDDGYNFCHLFRDGKELLPDVKKLDIYSYLNGDWEYLDTDGYRHLFRDGKELLPDVKKLDTHSNDNGDWEYLDTNGEWQEVKGDNNGN